MLRRICVSVTVWVVGVGTLRAEAVAQGGCAAARSQEGCWGEENKVPDAERAVLHGGPCPGAKRVMGTWMIPPRQFLREVCVVFTHKRRLFGGIVRVVADLTPTNAKSKKNEGDVRGLSWPMSVSAPSNFTKSSRRQKSGGLKAAPSSAKHVSWRTVHPSGASLGKTEGSKGLAGMYSHLGGFQLKAPIVQAFRKAWEEGLRGLVGTANGRIVKRPPCSLGS